MIDHIACLPLSRVLLDQKEISSALRKVASEKRTPIRESLEDMDDKRSGHPEDELQPVSVISHHSLPPLELSHPFAEDVDVSTAPTALPKQQLLLPPDPPPSSKVCNKHIIVYSYQCSSSPISCYVYIVFVLYNMMHLNNNNIIIYMCSFMYTGI